MGRYPHSLKVAVSGLAMAVMLMAPAGAHTEFQKFVRENSGRAINCAMCHVHSDGPEGTGLGQIGGLSSREMLRLNRARSAFEPGQEVDSPILNAFGNSIITRVGKRKLLELRLRPDLLAEALGDEIDLDDDGIPDSREYLDGTHPLQESDGAPWLLFTHNLRRHGFHIVMIAIATALTLFGLMSLLAGLAQGQRSAAEKAG